MKKSLVLFLFSAVACVFCFTHAFAAPWAVVANTPDIDFPEAPGTIHTIDMGVTPPKVYGPFLGGQLGSPGGGLFDVAMLPGQRFAVISNFGDSKLFLIDLKNPKRPVLKKSLQISFFAEDIAISPDGQLALVTDGGFSSRVAFIDLKTFTLNGNANTGDKQAQAVAIGPDNTVLLADYWNGAIHYGRINGAKNGLTNLKTICLCDGTLGDEDNCSTCSGHPDNFSRPVNVEISPNGKTALVAEATVGFVNVLQIKGPGDVVRGDPFYVKGLGGTWDDPITPENEATGGSQCIQFQSDARAYVRFQPTGYYDPDNASHYICKPNTLSEILIQGPGKAELGDNGTIKLVSDGTSQLFGVDTFGIAGGQLLAGNPTLSGCDPANTYFRYVSYVNLVTGTMTPVRLNTNGKATGVGIKRW